MIQEFGRVLAKELEFLIESTRTSENRTKLGEIIRDNLLNGESNSFLHLKYSVKQQFIVEKVFPKHHEIVISYDKLTNILVFISSFPYRNKRIKKSDFIRYHIENYFQEKYILKNRMIAFAKILLRVYKSDFRHSNYQKEIEELFSTLKDFFKEDYEMRGKHVHQERLKSKKFSRLTLFEMLLYNESEEKEFLSQYYDKVYLEVRADWKKILIQDLDRIKEILDDYYNLIIKYLVDENRLIYPKNIKV
ncbi:MAG: hypothetical protein SCALA702_02260 [Melioribacteraceae bacterium]|nr:MAG: hypothetical protein SCALA702_02260 [Melioribacteraceae bacterium]